MFIQYSLPVGNLTQGHSRSTTMLVWAAGEVLHGRSRGSGEAAVPKERMAFASVMNERKPAVLQWRDPEAEMLSPPAAARMHFAADRGRLPRPVCRLLVASGFRGISPAWSGRYAS